MYYEEEIDGVVYLVNAQTGEKIPKPNNTNNVNTPLASQQSAITANAIEGGNQLKGALAREATGLRTLYDERATALNDANTRMNELTPPQPVEPIVLPDFTDRDAYMKENDVSFPDPNDPKYQVDEKDYEPEVDKTKRMGKILMAVGATLKEFGNPQMYKGEIAQTGEMIYLMNENEKKEAKENYANALALAETAYNNDKVMYDHHIEILDAKDDAVEREINRINIINKDKKDIFSQKNTAYTNQINAIQREIENIDKNFEIQANKLAIDPALMSNILGADIDIGKALKQEIDLLNSIENLAGTKTQNLIEVKNTWNELFSSDSENFGLPYESKVKLVEGMATNDISKKFVELLPPDEKTFLQNRTMEIMSNANQMLGIADMLGLSPEMGEALMMENALGINTDFSFNKDITDPLAYSQEDITAFVNASSTAQKVFEDAAIIKQKIKSGEYSGSGVDKFIADSKILNAFAAFGEAAGFDGNILDAFEQKKKEVGGTEQAMASLIVDLIPLFTGEQGARKTTFDVTYTGETINSLKQQFEGGRLQTTEGQINALNIIQDIAKQTAQWNYNEAEKGKPTKPTDEVFAAIEEKYSGTTTNNQFQGEPIPEETKQQLYTVINQQDLSQMKEMFSNNNVGQMLNAPVNSEVKTKVLNDLRAKYPEMSAEDFAALIQELFGV